MGKKKKLNRRQLQQLLELNSGKLYLFKGKGRKVYNSSEMSYYNKTGFKLTQDTYFLLLNAFLYESNIKCYVRTTLDALNAFIKTKNKKHVPRKSREWFLRNYIFESVPKVYELDKVLYFKQDYFEWNSRIDNNKMQIYKNPNSGLYSMLKSGAEVSNTTYVKAIFSPKVPIYSGKLHICVDNQFGFIRISGKTSNQIKKDFVLTESS